MAKKDKFAQMKQGGGVGSFQASLVQAASTVAAIERQQEEQIPTESEKQTVTQVAQNNPEPPTQQIEAPRYMRLPNPQIPIREYNMVSIYCGTFANMTRQDWVELAFIEKLHNDGQMTDEEFHSRQFEIRNRPTRGQRRNTKVIQQDPLKTKQST